MNASPEYLGWRLSKFHFGRCLHEARHVWKTAARWKCWSQHLVGFCDAFMNTWIFISSSISSLAKLQEIAA